MLEKVRDFKILNKIGEGGMGEVFLAEDENLGRKVAIKVLSPQLARDPQLVDRFKQEARVQAGLIHPNIVALHNFFTEDGNYLMVMEFADGKTLKEIISLNGAIPEDQAITIFLQMLDGVGYAHSLGIVHRDIKPSNIIVSSSGKVKIMDFGIAKILGDKGMTKTGTKMGTVYYMSPEQIRAAKDIDQRTDIYSLGVTLYEMLTGKLPFNTNTESDFEIMEEIIHGAFPDIKTFIPLVSPSAIKVLNKMTEKEKNNRHATCYQCSEELKGNSYSPPILNQNIFHDVGRIKESILAINKEINYREKRTLSGHSLVVNSVAFDPDGKILASGSNDETIRLWNVSNGNNIKILKDKKGMMKSWLNLSCIKTIAFSPDGKILAVGISDTTIRLCRLPDGYEIAILRGHTGDVYSIAFSPDGKTLASGSEDKTIKLWRISDGTEIFTLIGHADEITSIAISPDCKTLASGSMDNTIRLWHLSNGNEISTLKGHTRGVYSTAFSPDGKTLASGSGDRTIRIWQIFEGNEITKLKGHSDFVNSVAFSPDGEILASGSEDKIIKLWNLSERREISSLKGHSGSIKIVVFSPDGKFIATGSSDSTIKLWELSS